MDLIIHATFLRHDDPGVTGDERRPTDQLWRACDGVVRDRAGNLARIQRVD